MHAEEEYLVPLMEAGAAGYLVKSAADRELVDAVRAVAHGDMYVHPVRPDSRQEPDEEGSRARTERERFDKLTQRERDVLRLVAQGYSAPEIGERLFISPKTVDTYKQRIQEKLGLAHRSDYVQLALKLGLLAETDLSIALLVVSVVLALVLARQFVVESRLRARQRVEDALRASEAKFSGILGIAADAIITVDSDQRIVHFNRGAEEIFGYTAADAIGRHLKSSCRPRIARATTRTCSASPERRRRRAAWASDARFRSAQRRNRVPGRGVDLEARRARRDSLHGRAARHHGPRSSRGGRTFLAEAGARSRTSLDREMSLRRDRRPSVPRLADACLVDVVGDNDVLRRVASTRQRESLTPALARARRRIRSHWDSPSPIVDAIGGESARDRPGRSTRSGSRRTKSPALVEHGARSAPMRC